ncbi:hypothetical protein DFP72DRAFT_890455 [Ephemerocybe angulata]|uniref:Uncharacterized protein n=1 Tax=Ephemerocybe angulata TaxID=980116 RepID=A0A8H6I4C7_9AGAR|nr:hypothetical protein DFP72DRAFT_890455 [Tulosesus angulatus]
MAGGRMGDALVPVPGYGGEVPIPAPNFLGGAGTPPSVTRGNSYPAYMSAPPGPPPAPVSSGAYGGVSGGNGSGTGTGTGGGSVNAYPTPPSGGAGERLGLSVKAERGNRSSSSLGSDEGGVGGHGRDGGRERDARDAYASPPPPYSRTYGPGPQGYGTPVREGQQGQQGQGQQQQYLGYSTPGREHGSHQAPSVYGNPSQVQVQGQGQAQGQGQGTQGKRRYGFWNSRGDHLTDSGYVVYAPKGLAYPPELAGYPRDPRDANGPPKGVGKHAHMVGYEDHHGTFVPFMEGRPELKDSVARGGREAEKPYESFVRWV